MSRPCSSSSGLLRGAASSVPHRPRPSSRSSCSSGSCSSPRNTRSKRRRSSRYERGRHRLALDHGAIRARGREGGPRAAPGRVRFEVEGRKDRTGAARGARDRPGRFGPAVQLPERHARLRASLLRHRGRLEGPFREHLPYRELLQRLHGPGERADPLRRSEDRQPHRTLARGGLPRTRDVGPDGRRAHGPSEPHADPAAGGLQVPSPPERVRSGGRPSVHHAAQTPRGQVMPEFWINMGPQHPMTHGLWNMKVKVDGETVTDAKPEIGYLHRGYEKIMEVREFQKNVVLTDRLCYVSSITWSHAYCLAVEKMMGIETPERGQWIRVVSLELQRIASHLMWLAAYGPDLGLLTGLLWALRERELFLDLIQLMSGARMNQNYPRVGGVRNDLPDNFEAMCRRSIEHFLEKVDNEYQRVFQQSKVFHMRTEGVGKISAADAINWGVTGPNLRACGVNVDLRRLDPYEVYEEIDFEPQVWHDGGAGDSYARFVCRFNELRESCQIILQALEKMPKTGPYRVKAPRRAEGEGYAKTEDSRGEALFYVIGDGDDRPYRVKIRSPVFCTMAATPIMLRGNKLADSVAILGSVDVCVGEMDK